MRLLFLYGPPAAGKLTIARELAAATGFRVFHNHVTVDALLSVFEFGSPPFIELRERIWLHCPDAEIEKRLHDPSRRDSQKLQSVDLFRSLRDAGAFQYPELPADLTIDTSELEPHESARLIVDRCGLRKRTDANEWSAPAIDAERFREFERNARLIGETR